MTELWWEGTGKGYTPEVRMGPTPDPGTPGWCWRSRAETGRAKGAPTRAWQLHIAWELGGRVGSQRPSAVPPILYFGTACFLSFK